MSRLVQPSQVVSWFLLRMCPSQTSLSTCSSFMECVLHRQVSLHTDPSQTNVLKTKSSTQSSMSHDVSGQSPLLQMQYHASIHSQWCSTTMWLGSWLVTKMSTIYWLYLSKCTSLHSQHLGWTLCWLASGMPNSVWEAQVLDGLDVSIYCGPHIGQQFLSWVFSLLACKERLEHLAHGIKDTKAVGLLNDVGIY